MIKTLNIAFDLVDFRYYIGATDFGTEGYWYWVHSGQNLIFTNWKVNEPRGRFYENCAWKLGIGVQYKWIDISCAEPAAYLCEKDGK
ncbi:hypothetical protein FSP39_015220 [Pinctada imbricata]|uniref:C-type lectin domain-containing protein n=1 Tax=Pinctada imbricata TaxID=66713 RepID=A0AA88Y4P1_PINIB|nr:hypothetical protein FSP39_015220 [Pinctada imbricata]